jgi:hypothetical protein
MNLIKKTIKFTATLVVVGIIAFGTYLLGQYQNQIQVEKLRDRMVVENQTVSKIELQVMYVAKMLDGEARNHTGDWPHIMSAVFNRMDDPRWANSLIGVILTPRPSGKGCEIDAMCDRFMEDLSTVSGVDALAYAAKALKQHAAEEFRLTHLGHSWATPAAAEGHDYFEGLIPVAKGTGHIFFADVPDDTMVRPDVPRDNAPTESLRPQARPADSIILALMEAQAE